MFWGFDTNGDPIFVSGSPTIVEANNLIITGNGGQAEISATEAMGIFLLGTNLILPDQSSCREWRHRFKYQIVKNQA